MKTRVREIIEQGDRLFTKRQTLDSLWQEIAQNFYPERADFTTKRALGDEFAADLMTGYPSLCRRDLANLFSSMLRPRGADWFTIETDDEATNEDSTAKAYLQRMAAIQRKAMYARLAQFVRSTKEADNDFATFGQTVLSVEVDLEVNSLLYRTWHLRDVAWAENHRLEVDTVHVKMIHAARYLMKRWPSKVAAELKTKVEKDPHCEVRCRRVVMPSDEYEFQKKVSKDKFPFVSIYVDCDHDTVLEETPLRRNPFVVPRWQTVSGSQYAHSPATVIALADARLLQRITLTLLEAGEKAVDPPMVATQEVIRSDVQLFAGGITWADAEYDERLGAALRTVQEPGNLAFGADMADRYELMIRKAFFLDQINLPPYEGRDMTAYEVRTRMEEYVRAALPLFEPMETEYNAALCELTCDELMDRGAFGSFKDMPPILSSRQLKFAFTSPLQAAKAREKAQAFRESADLLVLASQIDPHAKAEVDTRTAFRDALMGVAPAKWVFPTEYSDQVRAQGEQQQQLGQTMGAVNDAGIVGEQVGKAAQALMAQPAPAKAAV